MTEYWPRDTGPCEASAGCDTISGKPVIIKCGKPGVLRMRFLLPFGVIMCDECLAEKLNDLRHVNDFGGDFYEEDEPVEDVMAAFEAGEKRKTN